MIAQAVGVRRGRKSLDEGCFECPCRKRLDDDVVTIWWDGNQIAYHVRCLKLLLGSLGAEDDALARMASERLQRRSDR
jgi:hypothetical protein